MRTIWTPDGEIDVPTKSRRYLQQSPRMLRAKVSNIWAKDEKGQVILRDPLGIENTITSGAAWAILNSLFGYSGLWDNTNSVDVMTSQAVSGNTASASSVYDDGTFSFPATTSIANAYASGGDTSIIGYDAARIFSIFFGTLWFIDGSSGGLSGSHIPATITCGTGFNSGVVGLTSDAGPNSGWFSASGLPTTSLGTTNTTLSDSLSSSASGTPSISHSFTLSSYPRTPFVLCFKGISKAPTPPGIQGNGISGVPQGRDL